MGPLLWLLPAPSLRRALRPPWLLPMSTTPLAMSLSMILLQLFPMSMMPPVMSLMTLPLLLMLTSMRSPLLPPWPLPHLLSPTPATLTPTAPTLTLLATPTLLLPTTPAASTTLAALCPAHKPRAFRLRPIDRRRTAKDRGRHENWILEDAV